MPEQTSEDPRSDLDLIAAVNRREEEAFEVLYYRYRDWVVQLAFRFTGHREAALDVMQETFLYFARKFPGFKLRCQLKTFLYPAVRSLALAAKRDASRYQLDEEMKAAALPAEPPADPTVEAARARLAVVLDRLGEGMREVLLLRFVDGLSLQEIAQAMEIPLGTVKSRLHHALEILRRDPRTKEFF